ncbi:hypothetical protein T05_12520 [Trichinella murrelli]|uniref:Uncharacterized protein n=1 Tax=Trichinella murrelli TaxID=144512 RepID=A0A0V0T4S4_9BILA|nr:hypothetical protein T05_12520 [Trichinella murrelli]
MPDLPHTYPLIVLPGCASGFSYFSSLPLLSLHDLPPQALPEAMPQGIKKFAYSLRLRLRHFIAQYLPSGRVYANFSIAWGNLAPGVARGYAPGHKKICIFPQATP